MTKVTPDEAGARLPELIESAKRGEEVVIVREKIAVARLVPVEREPDKRPRLGTAAGQVWMSDDFDAPVEEFEEAEGRRA
jgi:antitoxin (DNA-binding transcriptional repressor) of toxin-antitoxin stability system